MAGELGSSSSTRYQLPGGSNRSEFGMLLSPVSERTHVFVLRLHLTIHSRINSSPRTPKTSKDRNRKVFPGSKQGFRRYHWMHTAKSSNYEMSLSVNMTNTSVAGLTVRKSPKTCEQRTFTLTSATKRSWSINLWIRAAPNSIAWPILANPGCGTSAESS